MQRFDYKFVRVGEGWSQIRAEAVPSYQSIVAQHAQTGWRLVQVLFAGSGEPVFFELIFERPIAE